MIDTWIWRHTQVYIKKSWLKIQTHAGFGWPAQEIEKKTNSIVAITHTINISNKLMVPTLQTYSNHNSKHHGQ
jgi:hypothetical protein